MVKDLYGAICISFDHLLCFFDPVKCDIGYLLIFGIASHRFSENLLAAGHTKSE